MSKKTLKDRDNVLQLQGEKWKDVTAYEGLYQVSSYGRIKHLPTTIFEITSSGEVVNSRSTAEYILNQTVRKQDGYLCVGLFRGGKISVVKPHQLVAQAFCPKLPDDTEVHHIDRDKRNNNATNLAWVSTRDHTIMHTRKPRHASVV